MLPEASLPSSSPSLTAIPATWRGPLVRLAVAWSGLFAVMPGDWIEMVRQWWNYSTYNHILLIPPILFWLVRLRWPDLQRLGPQAWLPGVGLVAGALLLWLAGTIAGINLFSQAGAVVALLAAVATLLGPRVAAGLLFPLGYTLFLVPFGDEIVPVLQIITAHLAVTLLHLTSVPAVLTGVQIDTPIGLFEVAEACSGVKFLVAMIALGTLVAHLNFNSGKRRALFMAAAIVVPIVANGIRAWGTIFIAQSQGIKFAAGFDHIVYGWVFFAVVMTALLAGAWRFFDRSPDDALVDVAAIEASSFLARLARFGMEGKRALAVILVMALIVAIAARSLPGFTQSARMDPAARVT